MKGMTDVVGGKLTLAQVMEDILFQMVYRTPKKIVVEIKRTKNGYYTTIWIPIKDFEKRG